MGGISPESGSKEEDFNREVYRLLLFYKQLIQIVEPFAHGCLMITGDEINMDYLRLCSGIEEILKKPGFESLDELDWRPLENLRDPDSDIYWEYGGQQLYGRFLTAVEEAFISTGEKCYPLDADDQQLLSQIQTHVEEYIICKRCLEAKWLESVKKQAKEWREEHGEQITSAQGLPLGSDIFVVHGHDEAAKESVARFIEKLGLHAVILHEQPNAGRTIIEKFEDCSNVGFAVVLLTPDDIGASQDKPEESEPRARQNVIFELGYFVNKLGRNRVCVLYKEDVEIPSDFQGVLYVPMDSGGGWRLRLAMEIKNAGIEVDLNTLLDHTNN